MPTPVSNSVTHSNNPLIDGLVFGDEWFFTGPRVLTYSFHDDGGEWDAAEKQAVRSAFREWANVANISFQEVSDPHNFRFTHADIAVVASGDALHIKGGFVGLSYYPFTPNPGYVFNPLGVTYTSSQYPNPQGDIFLDDPESGTFNLGTFDYTTILHELGHALGLKHPHDEPSSFLQLGIGGLDRSELTVMSYNLPINSDRYSGNQVTPMPLDILAIQYIYGANMHYKTGNNTYLLKDDGMLKTIWDAGGVDKIDGSGLSAGLVFDMNPGHFNRYAVQSGTAIAYKVIIEKLNATDYADFIIGNRADNRIHGGGGADALFGGKGDDVLVGNVDNDLLLGQGGQDVLKGGSGADLLSGGGRADVLFGGSGDDVLSGNGGRDRLKGGPDNDSLNGGGGADILQGNGGDDVLVFDSKDARVNGGGGVDTLSFTGSGGILNLTRGDHPRYGHLEKIDLTGTGNNKLVLDIRDVLSLPDHANMFLSDGTRQVLIEGDAGDVVRSTHQGWVQGTDIDIGGIMYTPYTHASIHAQLLVETDITQHIS